MRFLEAFATAFFQTFGITQPTIAQRRRAAWFVAVLIVLTVAMVAAIGYGFYAAMRH